MQIKRNKSAEQFNKQQHKEQTSQFMELSLKSPSRRKDGVDIHSEIATLPVKEQWKSLFQMRSRSGKQNKNKISESASTVQENHLSLKTLFSTPMEDCTQQVGSSS